MFQIARRDGIGILLGMFATCAQTLYPDALNALRGCARFAVLLVMYGWLIDVIAILQLYPIAQHVLLGEFARLAILGIMLIHQDNANLVPLFRFV